MIEIDKIKIGENYPPYVIAELSANHNGSLIKAKKTILSAKLNGASAVKNANIYCRFNDYKLFRRRFLI